MPSRIDAEIGGVNSAPSRTTKMFCAAAFAHVPADVSSAMPSEYPSAIASILISAELA